MFANTKRSLVLMGLVVGAALPALAAQQPATTYEEMRAAAAVAAATTTSGFYTKTYSVIVNVDGTLALGPAGATSNSFGVSSPYYQVIFPSDVSRCVYTATIGDAFADVPAAGLVNVTRRAGNINGIFVQTFDPNGALKAHPFHLAVNC
jgi:hypothetical protein